MQGTLDRLETLSVSISDSIGSLNSLNSACSATSNSASRSVDDTGSVSDSDTRPGYDLYDFACNKWESEEQLFCASRLQRDMSVRYCALCGCAFLEPPQWDVRMHHLRVTHRMEKHACTKGFRSPSEFFTHLRLSHNAIIGSHITTFLDICGLRKDTKPASSRFGPSDRIDVQHVAYLENDEREKGISDSVEVHGESESGSDAGSLIQNAWDALLLREWITPNDRINRWILHMLGSNASERDLYHQVTRNCRIMSPQGEKSVELSNSLVIKYWFQDDAANNTPSEIKAYPEAHREARVQVNSSMMGPSDASLALIPIASMSSSSSGARSIARSVKIQYSSSESDNDPNPKTPPRPNGLVGPPLPASMMGQFSSKVSSNSQKKHRCEICDERFTRPSSLAMHKYSHIGEIRKY